MTDIDTDALPIDSCIDARLSEHRGSINRLSDEELRERHPRYPRTAFGEPLEPKDLIHFVFVYANKDYHKFTEFYEWFKEIKSTIKDGHTVKCDDRESELFPRNHDDNINEICERAIFILPFLSKSFCDDEVLRFFTSEAIGTTRLDQTSAQGSLENVLKKQKRYAVRPIHTEPSTNRKYTTPAGLRMMDPINYYNKNEDSVKKVVGRIIEESIKRFEERKTAMENALTGTDGPSPMKPCIENSLVDGTNALSLAQDGYCAPEEKVGNVGMGEDLTLPTDGSSSLTSNALSDTPGNKQLNYAAALTNGGKKMSQTSKTAEGNMGHLSAEGRNFSDNEKYGNNPATTQFDTSLETDNGSISKNTIQNAAENTVNGQKSTQTAESETSWKNLSLTESYSETKAKKMTTKDQHLTDRDFNVWKDSSKEVTAIELDFTDVARATGNNTVQKDIKGKQPEENPREKGKLSGSGKVETTININCDIAQIGDGTINYRVEKGSDAVQEITAKKEIRLNTSSATQNPESKNSWDYMSLTNIETKTNEAKLVPVYPFSKGTDNQVDVLPSIGKAQVSTSVGLIYIKGNPAGTGFRVGEKYILTCLHVIKDIIKTPKDMTGLGQVAINSCEQLKIEFQRIKHLQEVNPLKIFGFNPYIPYIDEDCDVAVLELRSHDAGKCFPQPLTRFREFCPTYPIHFVGHPGGRQMKEDSYVLPKWSYEVKEFIECLGEWSLKESPTGVDHYKPLLENSRKLLFHTSFDPGSSGSPGVIIKDDTPCVVLMLSGGAPKCFYEGLWLVPDDHRVEFGYTMTDINCKMLNSAHESVRKLATDIFRNWD